ncbi:tetratricopeptide repeat protein [Phyllobacterium myrsinacearum]|uniref:Tetratricopeptide (TPR) repeat protein n=1 Tax=Phyllobacterium myrsinacearum TaxID=28101 RepID=A0A839EKL3_9HYPH|nr:tetratricopeptide repeat protein [Phyllobacterium myrsinacearum]MBA8879369.1 tetratricopeptide (TPR) repeat protein [Phyllobacterium myrsinacearum]
MIRLPFSGQAARRAIKLSDSDAPPVEMTRTAVAQADAARNRGDWQTAATFYRRAIADNPARTDLLVQLGHSEKELGNYDQAETAYRKYQGLHPRDVDIHVQLGHLFNRKGDLKTAFTWYEKALKLSPDNLEIARHVSIARNGSSRPGLEQNRRDAMRLVEENNWPSARAALRELVVENGQVDMIAVYANVTKEDGDFDEALTLYGQYREYANAFNPASLEDVEVQLGHLHKIAGDYRTALAHYIKARNLQFERVGYVDAISAYEHEILGCINEIYTCF